MIDFRLRIEQIVAAAEDPKTAVILLDIVLGYGAHPIRRAILRGDRAGRVLPRAGRALTSSPRSAGPTRPAGLELQECGSEQPAPGWRRATPSRGRIAAQWPAPLAVGACDREPPALYAGASSTWGGRLRHPPRAHGAAVTQLDWRPPADGDRELGLLARLEDDGDDPHGRAGQQRRTHWPSRGSLRPADARRRAAGGRGDARTWPEHHPARRPADRLGAHVWSDARRRHRRAPLRGLGRHPRRGSALTRPAPMTFEPCHDHGAVGPMAGILSPSMPVVIVENGAGRQPGVRNAQRGARQGAALRRVRPRVLDRLRWMATRSGRPRRGAGARRAVDLGADRPGATDGRRVPQPERGGDVAAARGGRLLARRARSIGMSRPRRSSFWARTTTSS